MAPDRHKISEIFGVRLTKKFRGKLSTVIEQIEHGHHVYRAYWKNAFLQQYEKFSTFLRNEICSNNLSDFGLKKGLDHLDAVRQKFQTITDRFAGCQAQWLNVHVDFPLLQRIALPLTIGSVRYPGIKIHEARIIRLLEVLLHGGSNLSGWTALQIHQAVLTTFGLAEKSYTLNRLRYDLRKLKGHALLQRDGKRYASPHPQRRPGRSLVSVLPQAPLWPLGQQPLPSPTRPRSPARQQTRSRLPQSGQRDSRHR